MKRMLLAFGLLAGVTAAHAAGEGWLTSYGDALKASKKTGRPVLVDFTGSDWCPPCQALEREVFTSNVFKTWAKTHVVLLRLDFPRGKPLTPALRAQNSQLAQKHSVQSFPTVLFLRPNGGEIGRYTGYRPTGPTVWTKNAEAILSSRAMRLAQQAPASGSKVEASYPSFPTVERLYAKKDIRGQKAPKIEVEKWLSGTAPDMKGKVILVDLWATWCPPCRALIPELNGFAKDFKDDLVVIGISDEKTETVTGFLAKNKAEYNMAIDTTQRVMKSIGVEGIPHVLVITPDGIVRYQGFPLSDDNPLTKEKLKQIIDASRAASKPAK